MTVPFPSPRNKPQLLNLMFGNPVVVVVVVFFVKLVSCPSGLSRLTSSRPETSQSVLTGSFSCFVVYVRSFEEKHSSGFYCGWCGVSLRAGTCACGLLLTLSHSLHSLSLSLNLLPSLSLSLFHPFFRHLSLADCLDRYLIPLLLSSLSRWNVVTRLCHAKG